MADHSRLDSIVARTLATAAPAPVATIGEDILRRHPRGVSGLLAYGSCLRGVETSESLADFFLLVSDYGSFHESRLSAMMNRLLPPNVYYHEMERAAVRLRAKYAVVSLDQFRARVSRGTANPYFWARFAQPCALLYAADERAEREIRLAIADAIETALWHAAPLAGENARPEERWAALLCHTYATELRSESGNRAAQIIGQDPEYYVAVTGAAGKAADAAPPTGWFMRRLAGKGLSLLRLIKAAFTFQGGIDYLAWKIARHSGVAFTPTPWQRRHPILASIWLLPKLYFKGGVR